MSKTIKVPRTGADRKREFDKRQRLLGRKPKTFWLTESENDALRKALDALVTKSENDALWKELVKLRGKK